MNVECSTENYAHTSKHSPMKIPQISFPWSRFKFGNLESRCWMFSAFASALWCWIGPESRNRARNMSVVSEIIEKFRQNWEQQQEEGRVQNRKFWFAPRNVSSLCQCLWVLNRSRKSKRDSKGVGSSWENWEILWSQHTVLGRVQSPPWSSVISTTPDPFQVQFRFSGAIQLP